MIFAVIISIMIMTMTTININNNNNNHHHQVIITNSITMPTSSIISLDFTFSWGLKQLEANQEVQAEQETQNSPELLGVAFFFVQGFTIQLLLKCWSNINKKQHEGLLYPVSGAFLVSFLSNESFFPKVQQVFTTPHAPPHPSQALPEEPPEGTADREPPKEEPKENGDPGGWESRFKATWNQRHPAIHPKLTV